MRKLLIVAATAVIMLIVAPAQASQATTTTNREQLTGLGTLGEFGTPTAYLGAIDTQYGPIGAFAITYPDGTFASGSVTCLIVSGKVGYVTGRIAWAGGPRQAMNNWLKGTYLVIGVEDNGNGSLPQPDRLNFSVGLATNPGCGPNGLATPDFFIVRGNYRVVDDA
jgi:hypothetical protein